jgi:hypothetical protein
MRSSDVSSVGVETHKADRLAEQQGELDRLTKERNAPLKK